MHLLALDTATPCTAVACLDGPKTVASFCEPSQNHSVSLLQTIQRLLDENQIDLGRLQAVAVGIGPGSFTGVRVGLALAKTVAFTLGIPLVGVSTLRALAENGREKIGTRVCPVLDALRQEIFCASYLHGATGLVQVELESAQNPTEWAKKLAGEKDEKFLLVGTGVLRYRHLFEDILGDCALIPDSEPMHRVNASALGLLALGRLEKGTSDDPRTLEPLYCRLSEAELGRLKNQP